MRAWPWEKAARTDTAMDHTARDGTHVLGASQA